MTQQWGVPLWLAATATVLVLCALLGLTVAIVALARAHRSQRGRLERAEQAAAGLRDRVETLERRAATPRPAASAEQGGLVITEVGAPGAATREPAVPTLPAPLFADLVLRESVVQAASLGAGVRRALDPATRHRIGLAMRREVKRARRQRRSDLRQARRGWSSAPPTPPRYASAAAGPAADGPAEDSAA